MFGMGTVDYADSQRQASMSLEVSQKCFYFIFFKWYYVYINKFSTMYMVYHQNQFSDLFLSKKKLSIKFAIVFLQFLCRNYPLVDDHVRDAMGDSLYDLFMSDPESLYTTMTAVQADVLVSNKVNIPGSEYNTISIFY